MVSKGEMNGLREGKAGTGPIRRCLGVQISSLRIRRSH